MPHQVVKASVHGSVGDLAKITELIKNLQLNILAIGGGEAVTDDGEVGVISMIIEPDGEAKTNELVDALRDLELDDDRRIANVEVLRNIHIALANKIGELNRAVDRDRQPQHSRHRLDGRLPRRVTRRARVRPS